MISGAFRVGAGHVLQAGREADRAVGHRPPHERAHLGQLGIDGSRLADPMTSALRTVLWPISVAKLIDGADPAMAPSASPTSSAELPQLPATMVVTPMRTKFSASG